MKFLMSSKLGPIRPRTAEIHNGRNIVSILTPCFFVGSSFLQVIRITSYKSFDDFEFQPDSTTDCGVSCP